MTVRKIAFIPLLLVATAAVLLAATATQKLDVQGLQKPVHITVDGTSAAVDGVDTSGASKRAAVIAFVVSGQAVKALVRVQQASNGIFVDVIPSNSVGNLGTAVGAMNLSSGVPSHPAPEDDAIDAEAIAAAGG